MQRSLHLTTVRCILKLALMSKALLTSKARTAPITTLVRLSAWGLYWWPTCWRATISPLAARQIARPDTSPSMHARGLPSGTRRCVQPPCWRAAGNPLLRLSSMALWWSPARTTRTRKILSCALHVTLGFLMSSLCYAPLKRVVNCLP